MHRYHSKIEWAIDIWVRLKGRALSRNAGYLIALAAALESNAVQLIIVGAFKFADQELNFPETPHYIAIAIILIAAAMLVIDRLVPEKLNLPLANPSDERLLREIRQLITPEVREFARSHPFDSRVFHQKLISPFGQIASWKGAHYQFVDMQVQNVWAALHKECGNFYHAVANNTWPSDRDRDWDYNTPYRDNEYPESPSDETRERISKMDSAGFALYDALDKFEHIAMRRIPNVGIQ